MQKIKFTVKWIDRISAGIQEKFSDTETRGLQLWVTKTAFSFYFVVKHKGIQYHQCIGKYPDMKLEEARIEVLNRLGKLVNYGKTDAPTARREPILADAIDSFCASFQNQKTKNNYESYLRAFSAFRNQKIKDITHAEIVNIHKKMKNHPVMANHCVKTLATAISRIHEAIGISDYENPARNITFYREYPRKRFLDGNEAKSIIDELEKITKEPLYRIQAFAILMMIYTGQRKSNVLQMDYSEVWNNPIWNDQIGNNQIGNDQIWTIPDRKAKGGKSEISVPLNDFAKDILRKVSGEKEIPKEGPVFIRRGVPMKEVRKTMKEVCRRCKIDDLHIHDLRRSLGSWMLMNGVGIAVVSRMLGHKSIAVTEKVYAHLLPEKISSATQSAVNAMRKGKA